MRFSAKSSALWRQVIVKTGLTLGVVSAVGLSAVIARAEERPSWLSYASSVSPAAPFGQPRAAAAAAKHDADDVDTEHIFGFSMGSDIGKAGEVELEVENIGRFGKRFGSYFGGGTLAQMKFVLTDRFRVAPGVSFGTNQISDIPGMANNHRSAFAGASMEFRYKVLDRNEMPFGLTVHAAPGWSRVDDATGIDQLSYGSEFAALIDKELIEDRLFAAVNFWFSAGSARDLANSWTHASDFAVHTALSYKVNSDLIIGGEARYVRAYHGASLDNLAGNALFIGPTFSVHLAKNIGLSGTWSTQVAGKAINDHNRYDLEHFERHEALLRLNYLF